MVPGFAVLGILLGGLHTGYSPKKILLWAITGAAIGGMMVPEFEPNSVRVPALWQMTFGGIGGLLFAMALDGSAQSMFASTLIGVALGFLAPYWLKYINF